MSRDKNETGITWGFPDTRKQTPSMTPMFHVRNHWISLHRYVPMLSLCMIQCQLIQVFCRKVNSNTDSCSWQEVAAGQCPWKKEGRLTRAPHTQKQEGQSCKRQTVHFQPPVNPRNLLKSRAVKDSHSSHHFIFFPELLPVSTGWNPTGQGPGTPTAPGRNLWPHPWMSTIAEINTTFTMRPLGRLCNFT